MDDDEVFDASQVIIPPMSDDPVPGYLFVGGRVFRNFDLETRQLKDKWTEIPLAEWPTYAKIKMALGE